ncbi:unnamed protein product, partial [Choristocarpus tenellus]
RERRSPQQDLGPRITCPLRHEVLAGLPQQESFNELCITMDQTRFFPSHFRLHSLHYNSGTANPRFAQMPGAPQRREEGAVQTVVVHTFAP